MAADNSLARILRPLVTRIANSIARAVIHQANDDKKQQLLQLGVLAGETVDDGEHFHPYGFSSVPLAGAEAVVLFPNGDRSHPLVIAVSDRRHRPTGGGAGEVTIYNDQGAAIVLKSNGDIEVTPGPTGKIVMAGASTGPLGEGVVVGTGIDPFTGMTYNALLNASSTTFAKK